MDQYWNRICEAVQKLAQHHKVTVPANLLSVTGNMWERDRIRRQALNEFLGLIRRPSYIPDMPLWVIAEQMDGHALKTMIPEIVSPTTPPVNEEEIGEVVEPEGLMTEVKPIRRRWSMKNNYES
jgi:hypothetical protein